MPRFNDDMTRRERLEVLLDSALDKIADQIENGELTASVLKEIHAMARDAGVDMAGANIPLSPAAERALQVATGGLTPTTEQRRAAAKGADPVLASLAGFSVDGSIGLDIVAPDADDDEAA